MYEVPNTTNRGAAPQAVTETRFAPDGNAVALREMLVSEAWESIGYPPALRADGVPGQAARQLHGQWVDGYLQPIADLLADQMTLALASDVTWDLTDARVPLITDQATAWRQLTRDGHVSPEQAGRIVGLDIEADGVEDD